MAYVFINKNTGKKERHIQCVGCLEWVPASEYSRHECKTKEQQRDRLLWL